jgi:hypothetical protein
VNWWGDSLYVFPPLRKRYDEKIFTLAEWREGGWSLVPGAYRIRGWFNGREGDSATFTVTP